MTVSFKGETEETIMEALDALDTIEPSSDQHAAKIAQQRKELYIELGLLQKEADRVQGVLF